MTFRGLVTLSAWASMLLLVGTMPSSAIDLGETLGGVTNTVSGTGNSVTGGGAIQGETTVNTGIATATVGGDQSLVSASIESGKLLSVNLRAFSTNGIVNVNSTLLKNSIDAQLDVLTTEDLVRLCLTLGGGSGCETGDRRILLGLIDARLGVLTPYQLLSLCLNIGASGCGIVDGGNGGGGNGDGGNGGDGGIANLSAAELAVRQRQCESVLDRPNLYERDLVELCLLLRELDNES